MPTYDKYDPISGGFRAHLAADWAAGDGVARGVGLDNTGKVVVGAGNTGVLGIVILKKFNNKAGDQIDVMTGGEVVEMTGLTAGTVVTVDTATGVLGTTAPDATHVRVGHTVEADRLVVRM